MTVVCWSVKGGSGTTVVAAVLALLAAERGETVALDASGDLGAAFGLPEHGGPGVLEWATAEPAPAAGALAALARPASERLGVVGLSGSHRGPAPAGPLLATCGARLAEGAAELTAQVVVDAGSSGPIPGLLAPTVTSLLVVRPCYLALRRAAVVPADLVTGVVVVEEPGRALTTRDIETTLHLPVVARVPYDPAIARAVDAGLLLGRLPATIARSLRGAA